jgi:hypothetical protein
MKKSNLCLYNTIEVLDEKNWITEYVSSISASGVTVLGSYRPVEWDKIRGKSLNDVWFEDHCFENGDLFSDQGLFYDWSKHGNNYVIRDSSNNIISTVKYIHEAENLFAFLTGYDVVSIDNKLKNDEARVFI